MIHILLPAYNEEAALRPMMEKIAGQMKEMGASYRVVVVNDGSKDATGAILRELSLQYPLEASPISTTADLVKQRETALSSSPKRHIRAILSFEWIATIPTSPSTFHK